MKRPLSPTRVLMLSLAMGGLLMAVVLVSLFLGTAEISLDQVLAMLGERDREGGYARLILIDIRLPRIILAGLVGFALALGGVVFQALLRNPLADPFILGVSSGAACGAIVGIVLGMGFGFGVPAMAFAGALLTVFVLLAFGTREMRVESTTILLTGVIINAFFTAVVMFFLSVAADAKLHSMLFWLYGDLSQTTYGYVYIIAPVLFVASLVLYAFSSRLNLLTAGEDTAMRMGVDVARTKLVLVLAVSVMIGTVVAFSGLIGFVGLIVPHLARMAFGSDHRLLLPVTALGGASFLVMADTMARTLIAPSELPVGVISAFLGAPFFLFLLRGRDTQWRRS